MFHNIILDLLFLIKVGSKSIFLLSFVHVIIEELCIFINYLFRSIKLFSRHIKIDKQAEALKKTLFHFAVGTPERLKALLQQGMILL